MSSNSSSARSFCSGTARTHFGRRDLILHGLSHALPPQFFRAFAPAINPHPAVPSGVRLSYAVAVNGQPAAATAAELSEEIPEERPASGARRRDVDDRVPEAHEGKDDACRVCVRDGDGVGVDEGVDAVDGGGHPGDEQGDEEQGSHFRVTESCSVGFHSCPVLLLLLLFHAGILLYQGSRRP